jgi:hypothetical protein
MSEEMRGVLVCGVEVGREWLVVMASRVCGGVSKRAKRMDCGNDGSKRFIRGTFYISLTNPGETLNFWE